MHQKKRIWMVVLVVLFFLAAGVWYFLRGEKPTGDNGIDSVFASVTPIHEADAAEDGTSSDTGGNAEQGQKAEQVPLAEPQKIYVYVCGAVANPGVYELPEGSRLFEAIALAGGFLPEADAAYHNLAREISDGERVYILSKEESAELSLKERVEGEETAQGGQSESQENSVIDLNTATVEQLTTLPGIGESKAESIIEYRMKVGRFQDIEEVMNVSGIGEAMFEKIRDRITVKED